MNKNIVLIDEFFPYSNKEPFLESEIKFFVNRNVYIFSCSAENNMKYREINQSNVKFFAETKEKFRGVKVFRYINAMFSKDFMLELIFLIKSRKISLETLKQLLSFMSVANHKNKWIKKELLALGFDKDTSFTFYSYWMHYHAYTALLLKRYFKNSKVITRCHGFDLYEYRNSSGYIPLRKNILTHINEIHAISIEGRNYLSFTYPNIEMNIKVSRLGTQNFGLNENLTKREKLKIVSCSWLVPVKRVDRIVSTLEKINDIHIEWTHFGNGQLYHEIKELAEKKLNKKQNIEYKFEGGISNQEILKKYFDNSYHVFINVSDFEGVPVSIMEAMSFGIPVIATDVGGVNEIVIDSKNGFLLNKNFDDKNLINLIRKISNMEEEEYIRLKSASRDFWAENYNAEKNYIEFIRDI